MLQQGACVLKRSLENTTWKSAIASEKSDIWSLFPYPIEEFWLAFAFIPEMAGRTRLAKYYVPKSDEGKRKTEYEVFRTLNGRESKWSNIVEYEDSKLVFRRYAHLYFIMCIDEQDNELAALEGIHLFVEILDHFFTSVTELDIVLNFHKAYLILDEFILAGELQETSKQAILERVSKADMLSSEFGL